MSPLNGFVEETFLIKTGALDQIKDIIIAVDNQNRLTYLNNAAVRQYGTDKEKCLGLKLTQLYKQLWFSPEEEHKAVVSLKEKGYWEGINVQLQQDGTKKVVETVVSSIKDQKGKEAGLLSISRDITSRVNVDEWLLESNERLKYVVEAAGMMVYEIKDDTKEVVIVRGLEELLGYTIGEVPSSVDWWISQIYPEDKSKAQEQFYPTSSVDKVSNEYRIKSKNGEYIFVQGIAKVLREKTGKPLKIIGSMQNIADRKNLQKLLREKERLAAIGITAGMVGHDIRNPLQAITSDLYLARTELSATRESEEKKNALESLGEIEKNIDYINKIVQDLQDYSRPLNPNPGETDIKLIIEKIIQKNSLPKNVKVNVEVEDDVKKIVADADYLNRILYNLITNAFQAMPNGGKLAIHVYKEGKDIIIKVMDTGVGIPKAIQSKMFTPMFTTKSKGQGFGLPVVKRMTESLGGNVSFESEEGKGTKFIIKLPITP
jgi:PAS domain S-box-containing protein